jgi:hypothetical protein
VLSASVLLTSLSSYAEGSLLCKVVNPRSRFKQIAVQQDQRKTVLGGRSGLWQMLIYQADATGAYDLNGGHFEVDWQWIKSMDSNDLDDVRVVVAAVSNQSYVRWASGPRLELGAPARLWNPTRSGRFIVSEFNGSSINEVVNCERE